MSRLPFGNPPSTPPSGGTPSPKPFEQAVITVTQLAARIDGALKAGIALPVRFVGEVTGFRDRTHWYFDLKDANAVVSCVMFQTAAKRAGFIPTNGQQVVARGLVEFYAKSGKVSVILDSVEPVGAGALELAYRALCAELKAKGYFDIERKAALPTFPRRIAIVTSKTGAALQDVLVTMRRRCPAVGALIVDVRVQGGKAAPEVADAIRYLDAHAEVLGIDAILVTRGGGSLEDLWAFNEREVADAILACNLPIVAAIGHETDITIAELVADERCATPTQAAMRLTPDTGALLQQVDSLSSRLTTAVQRMTKFDRQRLVGIARQPFFQNPRQLIGRARERLAGSEDKLTDTLHAKLTGLRHRLDQAALRLERNQPSTLHARILGRLALAEQRLHASMQRATTVDIWKIEQQLSRAVQVRIQQSRERVIGIERHLASVGPLKVLERGFSVTMTQDGRVVRSPADVSRGELIESRVAGGTIKSTVGDQSAPVPVPASPSTKPRKAPQGPGAPGLFE